MAPNVAGVAHAMLNQWELHFSMTPYRMLQPGEAPQPKSASSAEVGSPAELR